MVKKTVKVRSYLRRIELRGIVFYRRVRSHKRAEPGMRKGVAQVFNPRTKRWVLVDTERGGIISHKKSPRAYKNVVQYRREKKKEIKVDKFAIPCGAYQDGHCTSSCIGGWCCYHQAFALIIRRLKFAERTGAARQGSKLVEEMMSVKGMEIIS